MRRTRAPAVSTTGNGYRYVRCQRGPHDDTVYIHQLCVIAGGADPHDVFSDAYDVHHLPLDLDDGLRYTGTSILIFSPPLTSRRIVLSRYTIQLRCIREYLTAISALIDGIQSSMTFTATIPQHSHRGK
ncbi:hypothetical protein GJ629_10305 [Halapricum sp. CBA1109]|uniref:hypothetical protein n=1 Tax=Halapricum sp. CBA1109 TaxID=2668068 RepID=UPI0012FA39E4|nr:hypothetical protein [Halapricum sp. CBA1109]MUV90232.1 hypothetical protein [Halapricum sp. CBA1109]